MTDNKGLTLVATANGVIEINTYLIKTFTFAGVTQKNLKVGAYTFEAGEYEADGILGLDFFQNLVVSIDFRKLQIKIT